jgi:hypothetical protein
MIKVFCQGKDSFANHVRRFSAVVDIAYAIFSAVAIAQGTILQMLF